jgi:glycosyltransferase involved in cell wall biosynthesis
MRAANPARRVAVLSPNFHPRTCGVGDHAVRLAQELARLGAVVRVYSRAPVATHPEGAEVEAVQLPGARPSAVATAALEALEDWRPDAVVLEYVPQMWGATRLGSFACARLCRALRARGVRVVAIAHELYLPWSYRPDLAAGALAMRAQLVALARSVDHLVVSTRSRLADARTFAHLVGAGDIVDCVPIGPNALPTERVPNDGRFDLGMFSTLAVGKHFESVVDAFELVSKEIPRARLLLIGDLGDPAQPRHRRLFERIRAHPAADRIVVTGKLDLRKVSDAIAHLDVFLFPMDVGATTRSGTLPVALGSGIPVVATRGIDTDPIFVPDENVVFAEDLGPRALADAVVRLRGDPALRRAVSEGARALYRSDLDWTVVGARLARFIGL